MQVGTINSVNGNLVFDITDLGETQNDIIQTDQAGVLTTRFYYHENSKLITLTRTKDVGNEILRGQRVALFLNGYAKPVVAGGCGELLCDLSQAVATRQVTLDEETYTAHLVPIQLK